MHIIVLIPMLICMVALFRRSLPQVFLGVYLPVFLLLPQFFYWKIAALPPIDVGQSVLLPMGLALVIKVAPRWRFTTTDLWMFLFLMSSYMANYLNGERTKAIFDLYTVIVGGLFPYMIGKGLIEQSGLRRATAERIVWLTVACSAISVYEYRMAQNPFLLIFGRFFTDQSFGWKTQIRWGFGRVAGPYGQSELAGIVFLFCLMMGIWVSFSYPWAEKFSLFPRHPLSKRTIVLGILGATLLMTQARGPWLGCVVAVPFAFVGRSKHVVRNTIILALILAIAGAAGYVALSRYTSGPTTSNEQQNAQYRAILFDRYKPIAIRGGTWGWGEFFPRVPGQESVDNEYLFLWLVQGWVGALSFIFLAIECIVRLLITAVRSREEIDRFFAFSMLGVICGILLTIGTVFLGNQSYQLFFMLAGWAQAIGALRSKAEPRVMFEHVLA